MSVESVRKALEEWVTWGTTEYNLEESLRLALDVVEAAKSLRLRCILGGALLIGDSYILHDGESSPCGLCVYCILNAKLYAFEAGTS
jgi:hypothetical protein